MLRSDEKNEIDEIIIHVPFYTVPMELERCYHIGQCVRASVRSAFTKSTMVYCEQTGGPNFCKRMHIDKLRSPVDLYQNVQRT